MAVSSDNFGAYLWHRMLSWIPLTPILIRTNVGYFCVFKFTSIGGLHLVEDVVLLCVVIR